MPTIEQAYASVRTCQLLSNLYQVIHIFRFDKPRKLIFILAGQKEEIALTIDGEGKVEVLND